MTAFYADSFNISSTALTSPTHDVLHIEAIDQKESADYCRVCLDPMFYLPGQVQSFKAGIASLDCNSKVGQQPVIRAAARLNVKNIIIPGSLQCVACPNSRGPIGVDA